MLKSQIKKIYSKVLLHYRKLKYLMSFNSTNDYWDYRYKNGGNSGAGSYDEMAQIKSKIINNFVIENNIDSVIEFGCGDGNQLSYADYPSYLGFDVSQTIIDKIKKMYANNNLYQFYLVKNYKNQKADLSLSLDVIYHLVDDDIFYSYMKMLFDSSKKYVIIHSTNFNNDINDLSTSYKGIAYAYYKDRKFSNYVEKNISDFEVHSKIETKNDHLIYIYVKVD